MSDSMESVSAMLKGGNDPELEKRQRRQRDLAMLGVLSGSKPLQSVGALLWKDAENERELNADLAAKAAELQRRAEERAETMDWRKQTQADLNAYREDSLAARQAGAANAAAARDAAAAARATADEERRLRNLRGETDKTRREYESKRAKLGEATQAAQTVASLTADPNLANNPQAQMALVFAFGRMLDPGSVVREGEYKLFESGRGILDTLGNFPERVASGARLTPEQVRNMRAISSTLLQQQQERERALGTRYHGLATQRGYDPYEVVGEFDPGKPQGAAAPAQAASPQAAPVAVYRNGKRVK